MIRPNQLAAEQLAAAALVGMVVVVVAFASGLGIQYRRAPVTVLTAREPEVATSPPGDRVPTAPTPSGPVPINYIGVAQPGDTRPTSAPSHSAVASRTAAPASTAPPKAKPVKAEPVGTPPPPSCPSPVGGVLKLPTTLVSDLLTGLLPSAESAVAGVLGRAGGLSGLLGGLLDATSRAPVPSSTAAPTPGIPGLPCAVVQP